MSFEEQTSDQAGTAPAADTSAGSVTHLEDGGIVVGGRVYRTSTEVVKKIENADQHINTLEAENATKDQQMLELLAKVDALSDRLEKTDDVKNAIAELKAGNGGAPETPQSPGVSKEEIVEEAMGRIKAEANSAVQEANLAACIDEAKTAYGEAEFGAKVDTAAESLGISTDDVIKMAKEKPAAFRKLFLPTGAATPQAASVGTVRGNAGQQDAVQSKPKTFLSMRNASARSDYIARRMAELNK